jgi:hypothetical protein
MEIFELTKEPYEVSEEDIPHELDVPKNDHIALVIVLPIAIAIITTLFIFNIFPFISSSMEITTSISVPAPAPTQAPPEIPTTYINASSWNQSYMYYNRTDYNRMNWSFYYTNQTFDQSNYSSFNYSTAIYVYH